MARRGFTLVEAAVAIAVVSILAGMMAPLALKALNQRREAATRRSLQQAFEALFGARDRRVANMRADWGFDPPEGAWTLRLMVDRAYHEERQLHAGDTPFGVKHAAGFPWGWNGPYWLGDLRNRVPVDAWGSPILLRVRGRTVQLYSPGPTRRDGPGSLVYPAVPVPLASLEACVNLHAAITTPGLQADLCLRYGGNGSPLPKRTDTFPAVAGTVPTVRTFCVPAGGMEIHAFCTVNGRDGRDLSIPLDLLPGETRDVRVSL